MDKDKDIHNEIDEEIEGIVYDDNDTDAETEPAPEDTQDKEPDKNAEESDKSYEESASELESGSAESPSQEELESDESVSEEEADSDEDEAAGESGEAPKEDETAVYQGIVGGPEHKRGRAIHKKINKKFVIIAAAIVIAIAGMIAIYSVYERNRQYNNLLNVDYYYEGIFVDGISLGGLTREQAAEKLTQSNLERAGKVEVALTWDDDSVVFTNDEIDTSFNTDEILDKAWQEGRSGEDKERYEYVLGLVDNPIHFETQMDIDPSYIEPKVKAVALFRQRDPGEASVQFDPDPTTEGSEWFSYQEPQKGITTDPDALWVTVEKELKQNSFANVEIPRQEVEPTTTIEDLKNMTQLIVQFKSHMVRNSNREHNVRLACSMINGTVLMPGEIFSMNETTGKRTEEAGFKSANVIVGGNRLEPGIAGGVCQVSGTLFNAAVRADLEIVERHHHSFELSYLTRGRDATVNYGTADLRFKNTSDYPIYISMYTIDRDVYAEIYGMPLADGMEVKLYVKTTQTIRPGPTVYVADSSVPYGTTETYGARTGIKCTTYKDYYDADGKLIDRVELHRDYYRAFPMEVHYNPSSGMPR
jgi:vancomycin resistance protein YoaR